MASLASLWSWNALRTVATEDEPTPLASLLTRRMASETKGASVLTHGAYRIGQTLKTTPAALPTDGGSVPLPLHAERRGVRGGGINLAGRRRLLPTAS